jgi:hypothetical protein
VALLFAGLGLFRASTGRKVVVHHATDIVTKEVVQFESAVGNNGDKPDSQKARSVPSPHQTPLLNLFDK